VSPALSRGPLRARRLPPRPPGGAGIAVRLLFAIGLVFLFPAFVYQLAFDHVSFTFTGSAVLQLANLGCGIFAVAMILTSRPAMELATRAWPMFALVALALVSTAWSYDRPSTLRASNVLLLTTLFGLALAARLPGLDGLRLVIRTMVLGCVLSIVWVFAFPEIAVHQATDLAQWIHAGLWRGIFTHKQGLGVFAGLLTGFLLFYGSLIFSSVVLRAGAVACSVACLVGTQSTTGCLTAIVSTVMFYATYSITRFSPEVRRIKFKVLILSVTVVAIAFQLGVLDFVPRLFGKSTNLTGRADAWPVIIANFQSSGMAVLGAGFSTAFASNLSEWAVDNGFIDKFIEFGYLGSPVVFGVYLWILVAGGRLIIRTPSETAATNIFPFCLMFVLLFVNISESNFMMRHLSTVLIVMAAAMVVQARASAPAPALARPAGRRAAFAGPRRLAPGPAPAE
jgi:exopolysaccharide production protein ExoQ